MPHLSPQTLTQAEQRAILRATTGNPRDHLIYSLALGTGLRLAEIVGLDVGDVYTPEGRSRYRFRAISLLVRASCSARYSAIRFRSASASARRRAATSRSLQ